MPFNFATYTEMSLRALQFNPKSQEVVDRKKEILQTITTHHGKTPSSILFYGFNPLILISQCENISVTEITDATKKYLNDKKVKYTYIDEKDLGEYDKSFDWVVACDEYFTFANSEDHQLGKVFLEYHNHTAHDRNAWETMVYEMNGQEVVINGPHNRRSMFFKQMAKFSLDAGGKNFYVHKNLMYKSLIKKNYEHVISISY